MAQVLGPCHLCGRPDEAPGITQAVVATGASEPADDDVTSPDFRVNESCTIQFLTFIVFLHVCTLKSLNQLLEMLPQLPPLIYIVCIVSYGLADC